MQREMQEGSSPGSKPGSLANRLERRRLRTAKIEFCLVKAFQGILSVIQQRFPLEAVFK